MSGWLTTTLVFLPIAGALLLWLIPWPRLWAGSIATLIALVEVGLWIVALLDFDFEGGIQGEQRHAVVQRPRRLVPRRALRLLVLARRPHGRRERRRDRVRVVGGTRPAARVLRADALPRRRGRRRVRGAGPDPLLRVLRGDADPALRADRRLGRCGAHEGDADVRDLHDGRLAADAGRDRRLRAARGHVRPDRLGDERRAPGSSSASSRRSSSRRRSSRSTAGCRSPTASRRPRSPRCSRA